MAGALLTFMTVPMVITPNPRDLAELRAGFERVMSVSKTARPVLGPLGLFIRREAQRALRSRPKDWGAPSGRLSRSLAIRLDEFSVQVGSNLVYAAIQQVGGEVKPKSGKYLAIPVPADLRRRGVWPRDLPRDSMQFKPAEKIRIGSRSWIGPALVRKENVTRPGKTKKDGTPGKERIVKAAGEVMFALVKRVRIRGREYLVLSSEAKRFAMVRLEAEYRKAVGGRS